MMTMNIKSFLPHWKREVTSYSIALNIEYCWDAFWQLATESGSFYFIKPLVDICFQTLCYITYDMDFWFIPRDPVYFDKLSHCDK